MKYLGNRFCFIGAILDDDYTVPENLREPEQCAQWMPEVYDQFLGGKKNCGKKDTKDYHGMFNHEYFVKWMQKLLDALKARGITNAVIIMDNAKYHKCYPSDFPRMNSRKETLVKYAEDKGISLDGTETKAILWGKVKPFLNKEPTVVEKMARDAGHEILYSPPHYSDLEPIETVWAIAKNEVGRQYCNGTTIKDVNTRLAAAFAKMNTKKVRGCIKKAREKLEALKRDIEALEMLNSTDKDNISDTETSDSEESDAADSSSTD